MVAIRKLDLEDAGRFQEIRLHGLAESPSAFASSHEEEVDRTIEEVGQRLRPLEGRMVLGAFEGDRLAGVVGLRRETHIKLAHKALIWGMYVHPDFRNRGVGRLLVEEVLEEARGMAGMRQVYLGVNASNEAAHELYLSLGFVEFGREPVCMLLDGEPHDEIHMVRVL